MSTPGPIPGGRPGEPKHILLGRDRRRLGCEAAAGSQSHTKARRSWGAPVRPALFLLLALMSQAGPRGGTAPFTLTIATTTPTQVSGEGITLQVVLHNTSSGVLEVPNATGSQPDEGDLLYNVVVLSATGWPAPTTAYANRPNIRLCSAGCLPRSIPVPPGGDYRVEIVLTRIYDLTLQGKYRVRISAKWPGIPEVTSNVLVITTAI